MIKKLIAYAAAAAFIFGAGWTANGWRLDAAYTEKENDLIQREADHAKKVREEDARLSELAQANDQKQTKELQDALAEIETLRARVAAGSGGLRVQAKCPASGTVVPQPSAAPGVDDATAPRLTPAAEQHYFVLRERIATATKMIHGLQQHIKDQCMPVN
jgi:prophage endopeptidase